jgi:protein tyrosine/serine phosphatase
MNGVPNFQRVSDRLYRGGQPTPEGMDGLKQLGIRTIIDLRDRTGLPSAERKLAKAHGIHYHRIPLGKLLGPNHETMDKVLKILGDPESGPVYVHCRRGCDRTGAVIACHRIANEGWTAEEAITEARSLGMAKLVFLNRVFIRQFHRALGSKVSP